jgi:hypothetical protein
MTHSVGLRTYRHHIGGRAFQFLTVNTGVVHKGRGHNGNQEIRSADGYHDLRVRVIVGELIGTLKGQGAIISEGQRRGLEDSVRRHFVDSDRSTWAR